MTTVLSPGAVGCRYQGMPKIASCTHLCRPADKRGAGEGRQRGKQRQAPRPISNQIQDRGCKKTEKDEGAQAKAGQVKRAPRRRRAVESVAPASQLDQRDGPHTPKVCQHSACKLTDSSLAEDSSSARLMITCKDITKALLCTFTIAKHSTQQAKHCSASPDTTFLLAYRLNSQAQQHTRAIIIPL